MKKVNACELVNKNVKWNDLFDSEQELIKYMFRCRVQGAQVPCGYEYIASFQRYYIKNNTLTKKQMVQLKRLAKPIYAHVNKMLVGGLFVPYIV